MLYGIYLFNTVISYFLFGYKQSLLTAHQRTDIISKRSMALQVIMYIAQVALLQSLLLEEVVKPSLLQVNLVRKFLPVMIQFMLLFLKRLMVNWVLNVD